MENKEYIVFDKTESVIESWVKDAFSFIVILFCIYISRDSTWWTFVTGSMFLLMVSCRVSVLWSTKRKVFKSKAALLKWANSLDD